jgi:RNA polymerase sigma-70 factor (ECF subfamily)
MPPHAASPTFQSFIAPHLEYLSTRSRHLERSLDDANDLMQDTLERALRHFSDNKEGYGRKWLSRIMTNLFLDQCRRRRRAPLDGNVDVDDIVVQTEINPDPAWLDVSMGEIDRAVESLGLPFRAVCERRWHLAQSQQEIALALGISQRTVATRLHRARAKIRYLLEEHMPKQEADARPPRSSVIRRATPVSMRGAA